jgi:predicted O-linked N-acetylglucosamine transferase (SPINDLY family)
MKASALDNIDIRIAWEKFFHDNGISSDRFRLEGFEVHQEMLKKYHEVDIALDTFPHGAGSTTNDALYMGVPVIGLNGERFCSQHAKIIIGTIGHMELVAQNEEEYVKKAVDLANNPEMLIHYRKTLRDDYMNSPKADLKACTKALEEAYRDMWVQYVKENS